MADKFYPYLIETVDQYIKLARREFAERISAWRFDIFEKETTEVIGGLLARQLSMATNTAKSPATWNVHILPILLRCMADLYITFCWILNDANKRSKLFVEYGLGQEKLALEKYREHITKEKQPDPDAKSFLDARERNLDAERMRFFIPVNLGSWSELKVRDMAIEVGELEFYDLVFAQFSSSVHSTWQHIWLMNLVPCTNPLHMHHRVPVDFDMVPDLHLFMNSPKYLCKTFKKFDSHFPSRKRNSYRCYDFLGRSFDAYFSDPETAIKKLARRAASQQKSKTPRKKRSTSVK